MNSLKTGFVEVWIRSLEVGEGNGGELGLSCVWLVPGLEVKGGERREERTNLLFSNLTSISGHVVITSRHWTASNDCQICHETGERDGLF